ncbi:barstar family protein [Streptomyces sp. NPDC058231]|uniref:barstar family protein n=1 Tax=Streptomyces sp. NPDC058231 TaxID=3346392 RepID=UPI0036E9F120
MTGRTYVSRLDGREMPNTDSVFQQFYDGLKLPDYFGWNWDALFDCLRDLKWLPADHYVLIVEAADEALSGDAAGRRVLFKTLLRAGQRWSSTQRPRGHRHEQARCRHVLRRSIRFEPAGTAAIVLGRDGSATHVGQRRTSAARTAGLTTERTH